MARGSHRPAGERGSGWLGGLSLWLGLRGWRNSLAGTRCFVWPAGQDDLAGGFGSEALAGCGSALGSGAEQ